MRSITGLLAALGLGVGAGCERVLVLGSECPDDDSVCTPAVVGQGEQDGMVVPHDGHISEPNDGGSEADSAHAQPSDADTDALDAAPDARVYASLPVQNPNFERNGGLGGDVVLSNLIGGLLPIPPVTLIFAQLPNWYACAYLSVNSVSSQLDQGGVPELPDGGDYLSFVINGTPVRQELAEPIRAGAHHAFELDVLSRPDNGARLFVELRGAKGGSSMLCSEGTVLGRSALIPETSGWTTACVELTADADYAQLQIVPGYQGNTPSGNARLRIDSLRAVPGCTAR